MKLPTLTLALLLAAACGGKSTPRTIGSTGGGDTPAPTAQPGLTDGALWTCQIGDYDPQPCKLSKSDTGWNLVKLLGSQRFDGALAFRDADHADFTGKFFCPWGSCDEDMAVTFTRDTDAFKTDFGGDTVTLRWDDALASEWGGAGYGNLTGHEQ